MGFWQEFLKLSGFVGILVENSIGVVMSHAFGRSPAVDSFMETFSDNFSSLNITVIGTELLYEHFFSTKISTQN